MKRRQRSSKQIEYADSHDFAGFMRKIGIEHGGNGENWAWSYRKWYFRGPNIRWRVVRRLKRINVNTWAQFLKSSRWCPKLAALCNCSWFFKLNQFHIYSNSKIYEELRKFWLESFLYTLACIGKSHLFFEMCHQSGQTRRTFAEHEIVREIFWSSSNNFRTTPNIAQHEIYHRKGWPNATNICKTWKLNIVRWIARRVWPGLKETQTKGPRCDLNWRQGHSSYQ